MAGSPYADLDLTGSGFGEHESQTILLITRSNLGGILGAGSATVKAGSFRFHFPKGYRRSSAQEVVWLLDADGDGMCGAGDHTGYLLIAATNPDGEQPLPITITDNHVQTGAGSADLCRAGAPFGDMLDMNITGTGFDAHEGRTVRLVTRSAYNGAVFGSGSATVSGGGFAFRFRRGFQRYTYQEVMFFVDVDADDKCGADQDHAGFAGTPAFNPIANVAVEFQVTDNHVVKSARGADVCVVMNGCQLSP